jgi:hypothetical protein
VADSANENYHGLMDKDGHLALALSYTGIEEIPGGYFLAHNGYQRAVFDFDGKLVIPYNTYDDLQKTSIARQLIAKKNGTFGVLSLPAYLHIPSGDSPDNWALAELQEAASHELIPQSLQRRYTENISREEFCRLLNNLSVALTGQELQTLADTQGMQPNETAFSDVKQSDSAILGACALGIVEGDGKGYFMPNKAITRQEAAKMLALSAQVFGADITSQADATRFADSEAISAWAKPYVAFVKAAGIMDGTGKDRFSPMAPYTRQQSFATMLRLLKRLQTP